MSNSYSRTVAASVMVLVAAGCHSDLPEERVAGRIVGTVEYVGIAHFAFAAPTLSVYAFATFPPSGPPHGGVSIGIEGPEFANGPVHFDLYQVPAYSYFLLAELIDARAPNRDTSPAGAFPNACALVPNSTGNVHLAEGEPTSGIAIRLFDNNGRSDPCYFATDDDVCPRDGAATVRWRVTAAYDTATLSATDRLDFILFSTWPPEGAPSAFRSVVGDEVVFPAEVTINDIIPGEHVAYVCLDIGGDDSRRVCTEEDSFAIYPEAGRFSVAASDIVTITLDLDNGLGSLTREVELMTECASH